MSIHFAFGAVFRVRWLRFRRKSYKKSAPPQEFPRIVAVTGSCPIIGSTSLQSAHLGILYKDWVKHIARALTLCVFSIDARAFSKMLNHV